jgi:hypothetical protein
MTKSRDPEFSVWSRRQFAKAAMLGVGGGAALLGSSWAHRAFAGGPAAAAAIDPTVKSHAETELDAITSPHLRAICADTLAQLKYALTLAASGKNAGSAHDFVEACRPFVASRKPKAKASYEKMATALLAAPVAQRQILFSHYAAVAPATFVATKPESLPRPPKAAVAATMDDLKAFSTPSAVVIDKSDAADKPPDKDDKKADAEKKAHDKDLAEGKKYKQLEFFINEVKAIENTGGIFEGTDEIAAGGLAIGATGKVAKIKQFHVKDGFDADSSSASVKVYKGGKRFGVVEVQPDLKLPHEYAVTVALAELDDGGFGEFLEKLWNVVKKYVTAALAIAGGTLAGALSLSWIPGIGPIIGAIIGAFIGWLISLFHNDDDIVGHKMSTLRLHSVAKSYYETLDLTKPKGIPVVMDFTEEGHYRVTGGWRLVAP